jgi:hypothetical protein
MKAIALISILIGATLTLNAQETTWEGTHRIVSSTSGIESFKPTKSKTFCQINEKNGQLSGLVTRFGEDVHDISQHTENLEGTIRKQIIEWKSRGALDRTQKTRRQSETLFRGVRDGDTIVGYFEQTWNEQGKDPVTYRGILELNRKQKN